MIYITYSLWNFSIDSSGSFSQKLPALTLNNDVPKRFNETARRVPLWSRLGPHNTLLKVLRFSPEAGRDGIVRRMESLGLVQRQTGQTVSVAATRLLKGCRASVTPPLTGVRLVATEQGMA